MMFCMCTIPGMRKTLLLAPLAIIGSFLIVAQASAAEVCSCNLYKNGICYDMICKSSGSTSSSSSSTSAAKKKDLTLSIKDDRDPARIGETITYTISLKNKSKQKIKTDVLATLDDDMRFVSASSDGDEDDDEVTWEDVSISAGKTKTLTLKVRLSSGVDEGDTVTLNVEAGELEDEEETEVDDSSVCRGLYCDDDDDDGDYNGDVQISVTDDRDNVRPDDVIRYTIDLRNHASSTRTVDLVGYLDSNTTFISASDGGYLYSNNRVEWNNFRVYGDERDSVTLEVRVKSGVSYGTNIYFRAETDDARDSVTTRVESSSSSGDTCTYYNSYLRQNYTDYCDSRHEDSRR